MPARWALRLRQCRERSLPRREGKPHTKTPNELEVNYRHVPSLEHNYAVSAVFRGTSTDPREIIRRLDESQEKRRTSQPAAKSAGCIFKNPTNCPAGKLVDELGLEKHQRWPGACLESARKLYRQRRRRDRCRSFGTDRANPGHARDKRGIELETEVQIVGEPEMKSLPQRISRF